MSINARALGEAYHSAGHVVIEGAATDDVAKALLGVIWKASQAPGANEKLLVRPGGGRPTVNVKPSYEFYGNSFPLVLGFHWGLTSTISNIVGARLAPTYSYFRTYQSGDICTVHSDREPCEHSASMALAYSDGIVWDLEIGGRFHDPAAGEAAPPAPDFGDEPSTGVKLAPGDVLLYRGVNHRHGRTTPNPNRWSAHLFMHWIDLDGPYASWAFNRQPPPSPGDFIFPAN